MPETTDAAVGEAAATRGEEAPVPITVKVLGASFMGGLLGMIAMLPMLVGVPLALGVFEPEPIAEFVPIVEYFGVQPTLAMGVALFVVGGSTLLPTVFLVVGAYLPPENPRFLRGATFGTIFWTGFVLGFWPGGGPVTIATFLVVSLVAHWVYGAVLAWGISRTVGIPQHAV